MWGELQNIGSGFTFDNYTYKAKWVKIMKSGNTIDTIGK